MPTPKRRPASGLIGQLLDHPYRFNFYQAIRVIDVWLRRAAPEHGKKLDSVLRFKNSVSLSFPPSQIEAISMDADLAANAETTESGALDPGTLRHVRVTPAFMGFLGVNGVLPHDYTATIAAQIDFDKNEGGRAFFDSFSHRSMTLFYRAWAKSRIECRGDADGRGGFLEMQLALAGKLARPAAATARPIALARDVSSDTAPGRASDAALPDEVVARFAALIRHRPKSGDMIAAALADYFGVPFRFQPFVGDWTTLGPANLSLLGRQNKRLGYGAMLGPRYWRRDAIARLWVGPLSRADFDRFLASGSTANALKAMLALFAVPTVVFEMRLILRAADIKPVTLAGRSRLGHGAFLVTTPRTVDHDLTRYHIAF